MSYDNNNAFGGPGGQGQGGYGQSGQGNYGQGGYQQQAGNVGGYQQGGGYPEPSGYAGGGYQTGGPGYSPYTQSGGPRPPVSFVEAIKLFFKNYAVFNGRANRGEYWWTYLALVIVGIIIQIPMQIGNAMMATSGEVNALYVLGTILLLIFALAIIVPQIALTVRRFHDTNRSGFFYFISFIPFVGGIIMIILLAGQSNPAGARYDEPGKKLPATAAEL